MELVEQRIERDLILDVRGILDDQVRQGESRCGLTYTRSRSDTVIDGRNDCQFARSLSHRCAETRNAAKTTCSRRAARLDSSAHHSVQTRRRRLRPLRASSSSSRSSEGSHGILVNGTTAEPSTLTTDERNRLVTLAVETAAGRVPVVAATGSQSLAESRVLTEHALDGRRRLAPDRHAVLHPAAAARPRRVLPRARARATTCRG